MTRKRLLILGGAVLAVALVTAALLLLCGNPKTLFRAQYDRVRRGMTAMRTVAW
jgi:hypothetical protein